MNSHHFEDKSYVVFGSGSGLGQATAAHLLALGAKVWASDIAVTEPVETSGIRFTVADVTDENQVKQVLADAQEHFGPIDGVVTTAGILHGERILNGDGAHALTHFERVVRVNLIGTFNVLRLAAEAMSKNRIGCDGDRGVVVTTASIAALRQPGLDETSDDTGSPAMLLHLPDSSRPSSRKRT